MAPGQWAHPFQYVPVASKDEESSLNMVISSIIGFIGLPRDKTNSQHDSKHPSYILGVAFSGQTYLNHPQNQCCPKIRCQNGYHLVICYIAMERSTIFKFGKPSISMSHGFHGFHGFVSHNQRVDTPRVILASWCTMPQGSLKPDSFSKAKSHPK